jgi:hypothetical protein
MTTRTGTDKKRVTELDNLIQDSSSDINHNEDYHECKLLLHYLQNSHNLGPKAQKAWQVIRQCGTIGSGHVRVALVEGRCGSAKPMMCLVADRSFKTDQPVTTYNGRLFFHKSPSEKQKPKELKTHQRGIPDSGWGLDGLPFAEVVGQSVMLSGECDPHSRMLRLVNATGAGYMCNSPSMNCTRTPANVTVKEIKTNVEVAGVFYKHILVLVALVPIEKGDELICKYHKSGAVNRYFHFDCQDESHFSK